MDTNHHITHNPGANSDEISLKELIFKLRDWYRYLLKRWVFIMLAGFLGGGLGFLYAWRKKPVYTATTTFVFEDARSGAGSQYAGLAALAGVSLGGSGGGLFQGDNLLELYKSRTMLQKTLLSTGEFNGKNDLLINRYIEINNLRQQWAKNPKIANLNFAIPQKRYTRAHDSVITAIIGDLNKKYLRLDRDTKIGIINVDVKSIDEQFAKVFNDHVVETVNRFYIDTKTKKQNANIIVLQHQADSVRRMLNAAIGGTAASIDANPNANPALQILRVPSQRKQIDVQANSAIYAEIVKNLEMARLAARQDAPLIQLVDQAIFPLKVDKPSKIKFAIIGEILLGFFAALALLIKKGINELFKNNEN